jgi:hypothetical protein
MSITPLTYDAANVRDILDRVPECLNDGTDFDITPAQYHTGLDKIWEALGANGEQEIDVFTQAAEAIFRYRDLLAKLASIKELNCCLDKTP